MEKKITITGLIKKNGYFSTRLSFGGMPKSAFFGHF